MKIIRNVKRYVEYVGKESVLTWLKLTGVALLHGAVFVVWVGLFLMNVVSAGGPFYLYLHGQELPWMLYVNLTVATFYAWTLLFNTKLWWFAFYPNVRHHAYRCTAMFWLQELRFYSELSNRVGIDPRPMKKFKNIAKRALYYVSSTAVMDLKAGNFNGEQGEEAKKQAVRAIERLRSLT